MLKPLSHVLLQNKICLASIFVHESTIIISEDILATGADEDACILLSPPPHTHTQLWYISVIVSVAENLHKHWSVAHSPGSASRGSVPELLVSIVKICRIKEKTQFYQVM